MMPLVLLAGWGCDARIWSPLTPYWPAGLEVHTPDWPGHATQADIDDPQDLGQLASAMADDLPANAIWIGWSLGGLLAAALLDHLPPPHALVLLGIGDRFVHPQGVSTDALADFRRAFQRAPESTREHFLRWQLGGEPSPRQAHRQLRELLGPALPASVEVLAAGLGHLAYLDNQARLTAASCPIHRLAGEHDPLLAAQVRHQARLVAGAGHCPMLSQPQRLASMLAGIARAPVTPKEAMP